MSGPEIASYSLVRIDFSDFYLNPDFSNIHPLNIKEIEWSLEYDFRVNNKEPEIETLEVTIGLTLLRIADEEKILELYTESTYMVTAGLPFDFKYIIICKLINQTAGHAQGALCEQSPNVNLINILPQAFSRAEDDEIALKKKLFEKWD